VEVGVSAAIETGQRAHHPTMADVDERFQRFYADRYTATVRLARLLTGDVRVAEDLAQDAFVKVYRYAETSTRQIDNPAALLRTTTVNLCCSWHTRQQRAELRLSRHGPDPTSLTDWERDLDDSLRRLPCDQRAVIVVRYWLGLSEAEIPRRIAMRTPDEAAETLGVAGERKVSTFWSGR
jgi:DNA-directed RNA polymerase specialized sigma24 family protein